MKLYGIGKVFLMLRSVVDVGSKKLFGCLEACLVKGWV